MDEAQLVELSNGSVVANMRNKHYLKGDARGVARSDDGGASFGPTRADLALISPVCMASVISAADTPVAVAAPVVKGGVPILYFSNPNTTSGRTHMTVKRSYDDGASWPVEAQTLLFAGDAAYSCLTTVPQADKVGLLWETVSRDKSCLGPSCLIVFTLVDK